MNSSAFAARLWAFFAVVAWAVAALPALRAAQIPLTATGPDRHGWVQLRSPGESNRVHLLEASTNLLHWHEAAVLQDGPLQFSDVTGTGLGVRYFRLNSRPRTGNDDGKNSVHLPDDRFANEPPELFVFGQPKIRWIKFAILLDDETRVWFQDSAKYPFHYDFARLRLAPFQGMDPNEFDQRTLHRANQLAVLGAVLIAPSSFGPEYGIQIVGQDAFPREDVARWFERVRSTIAAPVGAKAFYVPTFAQSAVADQNRAWFEEQGIVPATADRWLTQDARYSEGWAFGRLTFVPAAQIDAAYADGRLLPTDILLTDFVPAEVPYVAGIITLNPATPNSHVAILARGFGIPFVWFADPQVRSNLVALAGREVALRTGEFWAEVRVIDAEGQLAPSLREDLLALKLPSKLQYPVKQRAGFLATNVQNLVPADARWVGGKAANYGLLLRTIPNDTQPALALTLDVWDDFLDQTLPGGATLRSVIANRLGVYRYPPNVAALRADLNEIRNLITDTASFPAARRAEILGVLTNAGFLDPTRKVRFRSSTNVEDSEEFTGAGLYDSYSGCLLDDLDDDDRGPSACDSSEAKERGVFRAIQKVYASFYNENAFLERLRREVNESEVGMAILVHHSFPDVDELANGVVTLEYRKSFGSEEFNGQIVTQVGAESVANPDGSARPEVVTFWRSGTWQDLSLTQASSLVPLGSYVLPWKSEYEKLAKLLVTVAQGYAKLFPAKTSFTLDFEFKRMRPGQLDVKQVRPLPQPKPAAPVTTFLLNEPVEWQVLEGEFSEAMAKHRAKGRLYLESDPRRLNSTGVQTSFLRQAEFEFHVGTEWVRMTNGVSGWPDAGFGFAGGTTIDRWSWGSGPDRREFELHASVIRQATPPQAPWVTQRDFQQVLKVKYASPQPSFTWGEPGQTTLDEVILVPRQVIDSTSLLQVRAATNASRTVRMSTQFYWPKPPEGPSAGYTAPNIGFVESRLEGLTPEPLILRAPAAQTYSPGHHNFSETFIFEPRLDPAVSAEQLAALEAAHIRQVVVLLGFLEDGIGAFDLEGKYRELK